MHDILLHSFLQALRAERLHIGVREVARMRTLFATHRQWSLPAIRSSLRLLVARDPHERSTFDHTFDRFFAVSLSDVPLDAIDLARALRELQDLPEPAAPLPTPPAQHGSPAESDFASAPSRPRWKRAAIGVGSLALIALVVCVWPGKRPPPIVPRPALAAPPLTGSETPPAPNKLAEIPRPSDVLEPVFTYPSKPKNELGRRFDPLPVSPTWRVWRIASGGSFGLFGLLLAYVLRWRKPRLPPPAKCVENQPGERFSFASVGGSPAPLLGARQAKRLGDTLDFVRTEAFSQKLDDPNSIVATIRGGGLPRLRFLPLVALRSVVILEDAWTERPFRSPLVDQLCDELQDTGVDFVRLRFRGSADTLTGRRGQSVELSELAESRDRQAVLVFTDGSSFRGPRGRESLARLAEWPRIAWMDLREASLRPPLDVPLPTFEATAIGVQRAFDRFAVPTATDAPLPGISRPPRRSVLGHDAYIPAALGDALLWAADCQFVQPCSFALADRLRRAFHPHLEPAALQRILALDGATTDAAGFSFDLPTLARLKRTWLVRRTDGEQERVLTFVRDVLQDCEPPPGADSVARRLWQASLAMVRAELDPNDNRLLSALAQSPVRRFLAARLAQFTIDPQNSEKVPLRRVPTDPAAQQRLAAVAPEIGVRRRDALPLRAWHRIGLAATLIVGLLCARQAWSTSRTTVYATTMKLQWIQPGEFLMGSPNGEVGRFDNEEQHLVRLTRPFFLGATEVTQRQYEEIMGTNPSEFPEVGPDGPVDNVSWEDAVEYCRRLTKREHKADRLPRDWEYRLPTEAQWEYACRAGATTAFHFGNVLTNQANFNGNFPYGTTTKGPYLERTTTVGSYAANAFGLHDMHGNVWEWCQDWYEYGYYGRAPVNDPPGPVTGSSRVLRGGCWFYVGRGCRSADRDDFGPGSRDRGLGFRVLSVRSAQ